MKMELPKVKVILCIDDDESMLSSMERVFLWHPYRVLTTQDPEEGLRLAQEVHADLIVLDIHMPRMNGYEVMQRLRSNVATLHTPIIILTDKRTDYDIYQGYRNGCDYFLPKPFQSQYLLNAVEYIIGDLTEEEKLKLGTRI